MGSDGLSAGNSSGTVATAADRPGHRHLAAGDDQIATDVAARGNRHLAAGGSHILGHGPAHVDLPAGEPHVAAHVSGDRDAAARRQHIAGDKIRPRAR